ncbi:ABC transporter substrate-binding protein [Roseomonas elaeocarpi]|uniref:ABC transporter substrate-binding protein n=1 Tax=Roseomonas elaeocarpi TaxID=907779 RepID=A0ABV6JWE3_9PROT
MNRRGLLAAGGAVATAAALGTSLNRPALAQGSAANVLRFIPQADVTILDPLATTAYPTRNHGHMCWDTLYGIDADFVPQPQLAEGHTVEDDGKRWIFTLRDGPTFHDGTKVRAADAVASIQRWMPRDTHGQTLQARLDAIRALDDRRFEIRLKRPFGRLLDGLAKASSYPCFIYPERFATQDPTKPFTEVVGSGPYQLVPGERVSGSQIVYRKFDKYVPTPVGTPSMIAGPKLANFERMEWKVIPDSATSAAAIQAGEVDWWEVVPSDLNTVLAQARDVVLERIDGSGTYASLRFNHLQPPFDDPAVRRALLGAVLQSDFMAAANGDDRKLWRDGVGFFPVDSPLASDAGLDAITAPRDYNKVKAALAAAGKAGAKVTALHATDVSNQNALMTVGVDMLQKCGFDVTDATSDWGTLLQRRQNRGPVAQGGWNALVVLLSGMELNTPAGHLLLRGNGAEAWFGWPNDPKLEELRDSWFDAPDLDAQKRIGRDIQTQAFSSVPYIPLGQYFVDSAYRRGLTGLRPGIPLPLNVRRG